MLKSTACRISKWVEILLRDRHLKSWATSENQTLNILVLSERMEHIGVRFPEVVQIFKQFLFNLEHDTQLVLHSEKILSLNNTEKFFPSILVM